MHPVSVLLICRNEDAIIARCLRSVAWADEIVVVDGGSTDRTPEICKDPKAPWASKLRWVERAWTGFKDQRNHALDLARHDWIFVIDADEECSPELAARIRGILAQATPSSKYFKIRRQEYFLGKPIHYGIWNPSFQDRLFKKQGIRYINDIHEYPPYPETPERIHEPIHHDPGFAPEKFLHKMNIYTSIEARDRVAQGRRTNAFRIFFAFPAMFLKNYFYYRAWRDGYHGFVISCLEGLSRVVRHVKIWQYSRRG